MSDKRPPSAEATAGQGKTEIAKRDPASHKATQGREEKSEIALREESILKYWEKNKIFEKSVETPGGESDPEEYTFYDGPPFATGTPHYGSLLSSITKDVVGRYKTMRGFRVPRRWGWDCHGLPIENIAEKGLEISGRDEIENIGIGQFNEYARGRVLGFVDEWREKIARIGRWVDFDGSYKTMDNTYIESVWWALKTIHEKGLLYEGERVLPYCPRCETPIANSEIAMDNSYKDIKDISITTKFELVDEPGTFVLGWTTTPWTTPGNIALAVGKDINYVKVEFEDEKYILAKERLKDVMLDKEYEVVEEVKGADLVGKKYKPLFDYYYNDTSLEHRENAWQIYAADFVNTEDGTGVVHVAPAFGEDDINLAREVNLPIVKHVNGVGEFVAEVTDFAGIPVKPKEDHQSGDVHIIKYLAHKNLLFSKLKIDHPYPHCHRCETPLYYYAIPAWFINMQKVKERTLELNEKITWVPSHLKHGRFRHVLEGAPDWNISRNRYWASPLPIWQCECGEYKVLGSVSELQELANEDVPGIDEMDLHRPHIDKYTINCETCSKKMERIPEVFDCWFESGSMPFASQHYPFENKDKFDPEKGIGFPADFIAEYIPQTRTWFNYMLAVSTMLFDDTSFLNVVTTGNVLAGDGRKMSKSLNNFTDPQENFDTYGVDAIRLYLMSSPVMRGEDMEFHDKGVAEISRKVFGRLVNVYEFYALYADDVEHEDSGKSEHVLDRWIIARLRQLHNEITEAMENYELDKATRGFGDFVDDLSTWYIRRSRDRYKGEDEADKQAALATTRFVLRKFAKLLAPFAPFHGDWLWRKMRRENDTGSVHLTNWCTLRDVDEEILESMREVRKVVSLALDARKEADIKVRQPLATLRIKNNELGIKSDNALLQIIADEVNVKEVVFDENIENEVELDLELTPELKEEGDLRELIRSIQQERKKANLKPGDMTSLKISAPKSTQELAEKYKDEIAKQAFISEFKFEDGEELAVQIV